MSRTVTQQEAARRIQMALESIESAQWQISAAIQSISQIRGPTIPKEYDRLGKLFDQIRAHWYSLERRRVGGMYDLDSDAAAKFYADNSEMKARPA